MSEQLYWHFVPVDEFGVPRLARGDGREVRVGETLVVEGEPEICKHGLHASRRLLDACRYCPEGRVALCLVALGGTIRHGSDKSVATERTVVAMLDVDATKQVLGACARQSALSVAHLWDMPDVVRQFLETGDESLRDAARAAAWAADAASAARAFARAADAARAAWAATWAADAARATWAADAARAASAASAAQNERLEQMALEAMGVTR